MVCISKLIKKEDAMPARIPIVIPEKMENTQVAQTFAAYLLGQLVFEPRKLEHIGAPVMKQEGDDTRWQLDPGNNFFLHIESDTAGFIDCRYDGGNHEEALKAMAALWQALVVCP